MNTILDILNQFNVDYNLYDVAPYRYAFKELIFPELLRTKEFEAVKKAKLIEYPVHQDGIDDLVNKGVSFEEIMRGDTYKVYTTENYRYNPAEEVIEFNDYVQIYDIRIVGKEYKTFNLPSGIWMYPDSYDEFTFAPKKRIEIKYDTCVLEDLFAIDKQRFQNEIMEKVFSLIEGGQSNIPYDPIIEIRCLPNSIKKITKKEKTNR
jgi:hypothetical protein